MSVVSVPPTAILRVDWGGQVTAAMTNTGCAPHEGDDVFLMWPDHSVTAGPALDLGAICWVGDVSDPGGYECRLFEAACGQVRPGGGGRCAPA
ncbi:MAG: hypothetical protein Q7V57_19080 [Actinomycetota bacterium]|nr:hypothetical protein [Actinomycetota bacterium]